MIQVQVTTSYSKVNTLKASADEKKKSPLSNILFISLKTGTFLSQANNTITVKLGGKCITYLCKYKLENVQISP